MDMFEVKQIWTTYSNAMSKKEAELSALYGIPIVLLGRSLEYTILGALVGIFAYVVGVAL